jgi:tetratricopeptide (TPR) repeat protein
VNDAAAGPLTDSPRSALARSQAANTTTADCVDSARLVGETEVKDRGTVPPRAQGQTMSTASQCDRTEWLRGERIVFVGRLAGMSRRDAGKLVRRHAAIPLDRADASATLIILGENDLPLGDLGKAEGLLDDRARAAAEQGKLKVWTETELWQRLGLVDLEQHVHRLYTPAMLAELLDVPVAMIRRWHRKGVIVPVREVRRLPYFDFQEVATARRLAELLAAGCSAKTIEKKLAELARFVPEVERPLAQLSVIVDGKQLLLRHEDILSEPGGQLRFDFAAVERQRQDERGEAVPIATGDGPVPPFVTPEAMLSLASNLDEQGELEAATELYRAVLVAAGPRAEVNFLLAELLYRMGDLPAARERYYMAIELDEDYVEARANLGCVLAEMEQYELAIAAFEGALAYHDEYPDVHYHLARTLDCLGRDGEAELHWHAFLELVPDSPWSQQARDRLTPRCETT